MLGWHRRWTDDDLGPVGAKDVDLLRRHLVAHHEDALVAPLRCDNREADARVATRRFDDRRTGSEQALGLGRQDHREGGSVLGATTGIRRFEFGDHVTAQVAAHLRQSDHGRVADEREGALRHVHIGVPHSVSFLLEVDDARDVVVLAHSRCPRQMTSPRSNEHENAVP